MIKTLIAISLIFLSAVLSAGQSVTIKRDKPINCEDLLASLDIAIIEWQKLKDTRLIVITRLGTGERDKKLNRARLEYVEDYLKSKEVDYLLAEGDRVKGFGRFEVYAGGHLIISIPIKKGAVRLCWGGTGG